MALQVRRGTDAERQLITPLQGELIFTTDTKKLYAGDGVNLGGIAVDTAGGGTPIINLNDLLDVSIGTLVSGQVLKYNGTAWTNGVDANTTVNSFNTIVVAGQDNVVADSTTDTLTLIAGSNITLTTNSTSDTITINSLMPSILDEGVSLTTTPTSINFTGSGVTATNIGTNITVDIPGVSLEVQDDGISLSTAVTSINFTGNAVSATELLGNVNVNIDSFLSNDTFPILGGSLDLNTFDIVGTGRINIAGDISSTSVDTAALTVDNIISFNDELTISQSNSTVSTTVKIESTDSKSVFKLTHNSAVDISAAATEYGSVFFERNDINGPATTGILIGFSDRIILGSDDGTGTFSEKGLVTSRNGGNIGLGTFSPSVNAGVDIRGVLKLEPQTAAPAVLEEGMLAIADRVTWDPATKGAGGSYPVYYDGTAWRAFY